MISTKAPNELPQPSRLREHCQSIALLDAILQPDEASRTHLYDPSFGDSGELFRIDDHEGSAAYVWFSRAGVLIRGFAPSSIAARKGIRADDVFAGLPDALAAGRREPAFGGEEEVTFAIWRAEGEQAWSTGKRMRAKDADVDGSATLLALLDGHPKGFIDFADEVYETKLPMIAVQRFYMRPRVRADAIRAVRADADVPMVLALARSLGFATEEFEAAAPKDLGSASTVVLPPPAPNELDGDAEIMIVRDGIRTKLVYGGRVHAWADDWDAFARIRDYALGELRERLK